jgi:hypothetical protein
MLSHHKAVVEGQNVQSVGGAAAGHKPHNTL